MFRLLRAIFRLNLGRCNAVNYEISFTLIYELQYIYTPSYVQPEDGSKNRKHVAESCKFIKYLINFITRRVRKVKIHHV
jgi:hypothetical protein